jgi:hypothetical protein
MFEKLKDVLRHDPVFALVGAGLLGWVFVAQVAGWTLEDVDELKQVPKTVRSNPGSYRAHYSAHYHYTGGK